jgi:EmrB/QacA subfamily drug resistance transporter
MSCSGAGTRRRKDQSSLEGSLVDTVSQAPASSASPAARPSAHAVDVPRRLRGFALASVLTALMLTLLLEALDQTVVGTALPRIIGTLQGFDRYTWSITAYTLASATMVPIVGKLSDQFGRKWFLLVGAAIFLLGSLLAGAAQTMDQFIACRAIQGLGAGVGIALAFVVVADLFPPAERVKWQSLFGVVYGFASLVGPTLGGWLTDNGPLVQGTPLGNLVTDQTRWRWVFYINLPVGIVALAALLIFLPANISERSNRHTGWAAVRRIDFSGALLGAAATICLLLGLTWGSNQTYAWDAPQVEDILVAAGVLYLLFLVAERFAAEPILPLGLFRNRVFTAASLLSLLQLMVLVGLVVYLPLFLQGVLGISATSAGEVITPLTLSSVVGAALAGFVVTLFKRYQLVTLVGALVMTAGVFLLTRITPETSQLEVVIYMVIAGLGLGPFFSVLTLATQNALPRARLGVGTSAIRYLGQLGGALGVAIVGTVVNHGLSSDLATRLPPAAQQLTPAGIAAATSPQVLVNPAYRDGVVATAQRFAAEQAVAQATATVPPGPQHDQIVAAMTQQVTAQVNQQVLDLLNSVFAALRQSLAVGIQQGFLMVLLFCALAVVVTLLLKDVPFKQQGGEESEAAH